MGDAVNHKKSTNRFEMISAHKDAECSTRIPVFSVVFMPTLSCNCNCLHCFEKLDGQCIDIDDWQYVFSKMLELAKKVGCLTLRLYWQGGEILSLEPETVQRGIEVAASIFSGSGITIEHRLQTNLLLYNSSKWRNVISRFGGNAVSSSLDFPNLYRRTASLNGDQYNQEWLKKREEIEKDGFTVKIISLPNPETLRLGAKRFYNYYKEEVCAESVQVNFPFPGKNKGLQLLDVDMFALFMTDLYKIWVESERELNISPFIPLEERFLRNCGNLWCMWTDSCAKSLIAIGPKGEMAQCDGWISPYREFLFGSIADQPLEELLKSNHRRRFADRSLQIIQDPKCGHCEFWKICWGGCPLRAYALTGKLSTRDPYCQVYHAMFTAILQNVQSCEMLNGQEFRH
jgi:radical SAM protein with 4Fe4S-binding SPASM domain